MTTKRRSDGVKVVRAKSLVAPPTDGVGMGRATAFNFSKVLGPNTWIAVVPYQPDGNIGPHHHGRHAVAAYAVRGRGEIRWGERLELASEAGPGDFVCFAPGVSHRARNRDRSESLDFVVMRCDAERIAITLDLVPAEHPDIVP
jgi:uncharacterized RmlC-like cupin family protein